MPGHDCLPLTHIAGGNTRQDHFGQISYCLVCRMQVSVQSLQPAGFLEDTKVGNGNTLRFRKRTCLYPAKSNDMGTTAQRFAQVVRDGANVGTLAAMNVEGNGENLSL